MTTDWNLSKTGFIAMEASIQLRLKKQRTHKCSVSHNIISQEIKLHALHNINPFTSLKDTLQ